MICSNNKNIDKAIAENQTTCLSKNGTLENEQTNGKNSSRVKDLNNLRLINQDPEKTPSLPDLSKTPTEPQLFDFPDINQTEDDNINNPIEKCTCNLPNKITLEEEITALKTEVGALKELSYNSCM